MFIEETAERLAHMSQGKEVRVGFRDRIQCSMQYSVIAVSIAVSQKKKSTGTIKKKCQISAKCGLAKGHLFLQLHKCLSGMQQCCPYTIIHVKGNLLLRTIWTNAIWISHPTLYGRYASTQQIGATMPTEVMIGLKSACAQAKTKVLCLSSTE